MGEDGTEDVYAVDRAPSGREGTAGNGLSRSDWTEVDGARERVTGTR